MSLLLWLSYVVSIALFLEGFVGYLLPLLHVAPTPEARGVAQVLVISCFVGLNFLGARRVGRAEIFIVAAKLLVLGLLVVAGASQVHWDRIAPRFGGSQASGTMTAAAVFFLSYMGFGLITNASEDLRDAQKNVPRAIYLSILVVALVYVAVSGVVIGSLPLQEVLQAKENALAAAARPALGSVGYLIISIGALLSIASALNATLYGGANIAYTLAKEGELPEIFERKVWFRSTEGLYLTALLGLILALLLDTGSIASVTSAVFISIYLLVLTSHLRLVKEVGGIPLLIKVNGIVIAAVFLVLLYHMFETSREILYGTLMLFALALLLDFVYRRVTGRRFAPYR
jgi:amino acid transporter